MRDSVRAGAALVIRTQETVTDTDDPWVVTAPEHGRGVCVRPVERIGPAHPPFVRWGAIVEELPENWPTPAPITRPTIPPARPVVAGEPLER